MNSIEDVITLHEREGNLEEANYIINIDENTLTLNTFTLIFKSSNMEKGELRNLNTLLNAEISKDKELMKEIKEFRVLFEAFRKLKITKGTIKKIERPDFVLEKDGKTYGIEITTIYSGNDWAAEKIREDIKKYRIEDREVEGYIEYRKLTNKLNTYKIKENLVIKPAYDETKVEEFKVGLKNKIFEKVRKMFDDYHNFDTNVVIAKIVSPEFFEDINNIASFYDELMYYVSHLEVALSNREYILLLIIGKKFVKLNLSKNEFAVL